MKLKPSRIVLVALLGATIIASVALVVTYYSNPGIISPIGTSGPLVEPSEEGLIGIPGNCLVLSPENCAKGRVLVYAEGGRASGVGFDLGPGKADIYAPADGYVHDYWIGDDANPRRVRIVVFTDRKDWSITLDEENEEIHSLHMGASSWMEDPDRGIFIKSGAVKKGELIGTAVVSSEHILEGVFERGYDLVIYPSIWWHDQKETLSDDAVEYLKIFTEEFQSSI